MALKVLLVILVAGLSSACQLFSPAEEGKFKVNLERSWARKTVPTDYALGRFQNRMKPLLHEDIVIQGNGTDRIAAFNRKTGNLVWQKMLENGVEGGATLADGKLYFGANNGNFYCVEAISGRKLWQLSLRSESGSAPLVRGPYVYHITANNTLYAIEASTGKSLWVKSYGVKSDFSLRGLPEPLFNDGKIYVGFGDGTFRAFDAVKGTELWTARIGDDKKFTDIDATAVMHENCLLVASYANALYCIDPASGKTTWSVSEGGFNKVTIHQNQIYYPTNKNKILVIDSKSGKRLSEIPLAKGLASPITSYNRWLIFNQNNGGVAIYDTQSKQFVSEYETGHGSLAEVALDEEQKELYFISNDSNLFKLKIKTATRNEFPWRGKKSL